MIPSHDIAQMILNFIRSLMKTSHLPESQAIEQIIYIILISAAAIILGYLIRMLILWGVRKMLKVRKTRFGEELLRQRIITRCSHIIPPIVFLCLLPFAFDSSSHALDIIRKIILIYMTLMFGVGLTAIIGFIWTNYNQRANKDNHPLKGVMDVAVGIVWIIVLIICASVLIQKSPMALLGGLGAFAAVLMLVFKDPILGFVAGIQLSSNDMLRVGDWIVVPSTIANGIVVDVSLTVVKVQNWDNTIVTVPPYSLVSTSFQNWRGMSDSGVRQIDRSILIDNPTIMAADDALLESVSQKYPEMKEYINTRREEAQAGKPFEFNGGVAPVNGTIDTNLGLFRAYLCKYLLNHPAISNTNNIIVRLMTPTENGTPLDIYCFTNTTDWLAYEAIRSQIFEHISATAPDFGLKVFATYISNVTLQKD